MVHKLSHNKKETAAIIIPSFLERKLPQYKELNEIFDNVLIFNYSKYNGKSKEYIVNSIFSDFDSLIKNIEKYNMFYVGGAHYYFSAYLSENRKKFCVLEDGAGLLSRPELLEETVIEQKVLCCDLINEYGLFRMDNENIEHILCLMSAQKEGFFDSRAVDFDVVKLISDIDRESLKKIMTFFRCPPIIESQPDSVILLTQHFANLNQMSFESQIKIYQLHFDYFLTKGEVIIKPHPDDIMYYSKLFPDATVIKERFPSELLPYMFTNRPRCISTISSTGINLIESEFEQIIKFDVPYEKIFENIHKYYFGIKALAYIGVDNFAVMDCHELLINNLLQFTDINSLEMSVNDNSRAVIVGDYSANVFNENILNYDIAVFLNCRKSYTFIDGVSILQTVPVCIKKEATCLDENYFNLEDEVIYIYIKDIDERNIMKSFFEEKALYASGMDLKTANLDEKDIYIKLLEGQIDALERRLLAYINNNKGEKE